MKILIRLSVVLLMAMSSIAQAQFFAGGYVNVDGANSNSSAQNIGGTAAIGNGFAATTTQNSAGNVSAAQTTQGLGVTNTTTTSLSGTQGSSATLSLGNAIGGSAFGGNAGGGANAFGAQGAILILP